MGGTMTSGAERSSCTDLMTGGGGGSQRRLPHAGQMQQTNRQMKQTNKVNKQTNKTNKEK